MNIKFFKDILEFEYINDKLEYLIENNFNENLDESGTRIGNRFSYRTIGILQDVVNKLHSLEVDLYNIEDLMQKKMPESEFIRLYE
jgi:hypothetical protein